MAPPGAPRSSGSLCTPAHAGGVAMAIKFSRAENGAYIIDDTTTGETRRFEDQPSWLLASLVELLRGTERIEAGLADLQAMHERPVPYIATPEKAVELLGGHPRDYDG